MTENTLHIIHLERRTDRFELLKNELRLQRVTDFKIWSGIDDTELLARGILKSHQQIVEFARQSSLKQITIVEDDIYFTAKRALLYYWQQQPKDYDLYLGGITWGQILDDNTVKDFSGASFYTIRQRFYSTFLSLPQGKDFDRELAGKGKFMVCSPMVACQHNGYSDNQKRYIDFGPLIRRKKWF